MKNNKILNLTNRVLLGALALGTVAGLVVVPLDQSLPIHWDISGNPDNWAPALVAILFPLILAIAVIALMAFGKRGMQKDFEAGQHVIEVSVSIVLAVALVILATVIAYGLGHTLDIPRIATAMVGAIFLVLGNYLPKSQPNRVAGVRVPWTMNDPANWAITNRRTGQLMMIGGIVALIAAIANPPSALMIFILAAAILVPVIASLWISYSLSRR